MGLIYRKVSWKINRFIFSVRGRFGAILPCARNSGILIAYIAGALITYKYTTYFFIFIPIIYLIWIHFLPNTPQFYLKKDQFQVSDFYRI